MNQEEQIERFESLESRLAFQDDTIESLNQTVTALNDEVQLLKAQLKIVAEKGRSEGPDITNASEVEIPPHY